MTSTVTTPSGPLTESLRGLAVGLATVLVLTVADRWLGDRVVPIAAVVVAPLLAAVWAGPRQVGAVTVAALAGGLVMGQNAGLIGSSDLVWRLGVVGAGGVLSAAMASGRVRAGEKLAATDARNRAIIESATEGICVIDADGRLSLANERLGVLLGLEPESMIGRRFADFAASGVVGGIERLRDPAAPIPGFRGEVELRTDSGESVLTYVSARLLADNESSGAVLAMVTDLSEREARNRDLRTMFDGSTVAMMQVSPDGVVLDVNAAMCTWLGFDREDFVGHVAGERVHPDDRRPEQRAEVLAGRSGAWSGTVRLAHRDGTWRWTRTNASVLHGPGGEPATILLQILDVTADKHTEEELTSMLAALREGVIVYDSASVVVTSNQAAADLLGFDRAALGPGVPYPADLASRMVDEDGLALSPDGLALARTTAGATIDSETFGYNHPDGRRRWFSISTQHITLGSSRHIAVSFFDITDRYHLEQALHEEVLTDPLTGLANRVALADRLAAAGSARTSGLALLFIDLDHFKQINDTRGHDIGDQVLIEVARRLASAVREGDTVARFGGDEFVVLCPDCTTAQEAEAVCGRILDGLSLPVKTSGGAEPVGASIGAFFTELPSGQEPAEMLRLADAALYEAKAAGRGQYVSRHGHTPHAAS